ncbi:MAG TPA: HNH endonuclease [Nannocystis sp.]
MLSRAELLARFDAIRQAQLRGYGRAPHKPLFLLYLLGRLQRRPPGDRAPLRVTYAEVDEAVSPLIDEFGPPAKDAHRAARPFFHLDATLWRLDRDNLDATHARLRERNAVGELDPAVVVTLAADPALLVEVAWRLLRANFPDTYARPICAAVGLELGAPPATDPAAAATRASRDAQFRADVLAAYSYTCAFCGYAGLLDAGTRLNPVGLAAAHVHWHACNGPDHVTNGLALCDLHHTLFDRGLLTVDPGRAILVSPRFIPHDDRARALVHDLHLRTPRSADLAVPDERFAWHRTQVFRAT